MAEARVTDEDLKQVFDLFDTDGTGKLDEEELTFALKSLGYSKVTKADIDEMMGSRDPRLIDFDSFSDMVKGKMVEAGSPQEVKAAFKLFDPEGNGRISLLDLQKVSEVVEGQAAPEAFLREVIKAADEDEDGCLDFREFENAVTKYHKRN
eukprot:TRINITY_DN42565_c0_g1_i1.p1 TRINITY_DN42565_c0_g1~~TRINITY_DN42565_c0_g1_i1.p1  ORF type:complete len:151 (+),score=51.87 TRINITY_DN42565_c0_g1_i1:68-520(+)